MLILSTNDEGKIKKLSKKMNIVCKNISYIGGETFMTIKNNINPSSDNLNEFIVNLKKEKIDYTIHCE
jgi:hypothetical protein